MNGSTSKIVPIRIPPNGSSGDCKRVVETVRDAFIELSGGVDDGGAQIYLAMGSWISSINGLNEEQSLLFTRQCQQRIGTIQSRF